MDTKALIRKRVLELRDGMGADERERKGRQIAEKTVNHPLFQKADSILCYASYRSEADTYALMRQAWKLGKKVYCPKVQGKEMEFYRIFSLEGLAEGYKGINEPKGQEGLQFAVADKKEGSCLMVMPGAVFDKGRNRIGYGGGYYDRYLEKHTGLATIALCFDLQVQEKVPSEDYDRKPDILITESHIYIECY